MIKVGITGGIGSGKSFVSHILQVMGHPVFFSDEESRRITNDDIDVIESIISLIGPMSYDNGILNKTYVSARIFEDVTLLERVNAIVHPAVRKAFDKWCEKQSSEIVFNEAAILFETGSYRNFDKMVLVTAPLDLRIQRVLDRDKMTKKAIEDRMARQWSDEDKIPLSDIVIVNDGFRPLLTQIEEMIEELTYSTSS